MVTSNNFYDELKRWFSQHTDDDIKSPDDLFSNVTYNLSVLDGYRCALADGVRVTVNLNGKKITDAN